jgi:hypothetical protein
MTAPNREAVEAAASVMPGGWADALATAERALTAALPFLAPQPSQSDEDGARVIAEKRYRDDETIGWLTNAIVRFAAAVRAEATLAEREACAKVAEDFAPKFRENGHAMRNVIERGMAIAAAIRARKQ